MCVCLREKGTDKETNWQRQREDTKKLELTNEREQKRDERRKKKK